MNFGTNTEVIEYINSLKDYQGYVQFSDRPIEDIYTTPSSISVDAKGGFIYEAHFCNDVESITIKQINDAWIGSNTNIKDIKDEDMTTYFAYEKNVKMAQIWQEESDDMCEGMLVKKLKKVVFAGFVGGEK